MMWPVLTKVRYELLGGLLRSRAIWGQLAISLIANWVIGPAIMVSNLGPPHALPCCCAVEPAMQAVLRLKLLDWEQPKAAARRIAGLPCHRWCPCMAPTSCQGEQGRAHSFASYRKGTSKKGSPS